MVILKIQNVTTWIVFINPVTYSDVFKDELGILQGIEGTVSVDQ